MTQQTRANLKAKFETGDKPTQTDYEDLIDSNLNLVDTTAQNITSNINFLGGGLVIDGSVSAKDRMFIAGQAEVSGQAIFRSRVSAHQDIVSSSLNTGIISAASIHTSGSQNVFDGQLVIGGDLVVSGNVTAKQTIGVSSLRVDAHASASSMAITGIASASAFHSQLMTTSALTFSVTANTTAAQSAPAWAELSAVNHFQKVTFGGNSSMCIPLISASF